MGLVFAAAAHLFACTMPILEYGADPLKERVLPKLCTGAWIGSNAITETEAGSDVFAMKAYAVRDGDHYTLNGTKSYVTSGPVADVMLVYAKTDPASGFLGVSAFVVESGTPGLVAEEPFEKMGLTSVPASVVHLKDCRVPAANRLAAEGQGGLIFNRSMQWERTGLFAGYLGVMQRQFDLSVDRARKRRQFGKPIGKNQAISHRIVDMKLRLEAARLLLARACWRLDRGEEATVDVSLAKLAISEAAVQSSIDAAHIFGGDGFATTTGIERGLWDAMASTLVSGSSEMQRETIAGQLRL
jgi:alkylation response protein AidB-like acyl-CoA dehydrogenase